MAEALPSKSGPYLKFLTDCMYYINGQCKSNGDCNYRHCRAAAEQINKCSKWPKTCRNITCPYRHPPVKKKVLGVDTLVNHPCQPKPQPLLAMRQERFISFFWDIENVPIPRGQKAFDIVQRIREKFVIGSGLQEAAFSCYCDINTIPKENQQSLDHANVRIIHVPDRKPGAADRQIMLELDRFERIHRPPATVVLISGDIDFVGKLSDLRHQAGFHVIVIHNGPAKSELKATAHEHYSWELFTIPRQQPINVVNGLDLAREEPPVRPVQSNRMRHSSSSRNLRRRDPSPCRPIASYKPQPIVINQDIKKHRCPKCPSEFESILALRQHQNAKNHLFNCPVCNESFVATEALTQHQKDKKHYVLDYRCNQCNRYFAKLDSLNQHQQATGHISLSMQTSDHKQFIPQQTLPSNTFTSHNIDDESMLIILQGIEAIRQHFAKWLPKNN